MLDLNSKQPFHCFVIKLKCEDVRCLDALRISDGFTRWISSRGKKGKEELRNYLKSKLALENEIYAAICTSKGKNELVGFAVITNWPGLPRAKAIDSVEVASPHRGRGIGSAIIRKIINQENTILVLMFSPELGREKELEKFYRKFGFDYLTEDYMVYLPSDFQRLRKWASFVDTLLEIYNSLKEKINSKCDQIVSAKVIPRSKETKK